MAQGLVGVGGVPRNIAEIKVGAGGVRTVTEAYVGVNGAPRLCWSGNKWANKVYIADGNSLRKIDAGTLVESFFATAPVGSLFRAGGGYNQFYHYDGSEESSWVRDMATMAAVRSLGRMYSYPHSNVERWGAYAYYRIYSNTNVIGMDVNTYAQASWYASSPESGAAHAFVATNTAGFYADGWMSSGMSMVRLDGVPGNTIKTVVYAMSAAITYWYKYTVTDKAFFEFDKPPDAPAGKGTVYKRDLSTGTLVASSYVTATSGIRNHVSIFSPKKRDR